MKIECTNKINKNTIPHCVYHFIKFPGFKQALLISKVTKKELAKRYLNVKLI